MVTPAASVEPTTNYRAQYDEYWAMEDRICESSGDLSQTSEQIVSCCGVGRLLDIGCGEGGLVAALLRKGVDAYGVDVSEVVIARCNQRVPNRFVQGSVLSLPFGSDAFQTVVSTDCMEHLAPGDVPSALKEIHRVASRYVFLKLATTRDRDSRWHLTVEGRAWWEQKCFEAGFRKHSAYYRVNGYESLNEEGWQIVIPLEKIADTILSRYPLSALKDERDLHMDMLREHGSRSDAHVFRYHYASKYVRPGDTVLDAACGLGYGAKVISSMTKCSTVSGIDESAHGIAYAESNFGCEGAVQFIQGVLPDCLRSFPDSSVDCVVCFETLEHVENPKALLGEFQRILTPGGRLVCSVPNDWSDETGRDPNPFHLHVYTLPKFLSELTEYFEIESLAAQTADRVKSSGSKNWLPRARAFSEFFRLDEASAAQEAEWLLALACKSPMDGGLVPYVEKAFSAGEQIASGNALAFARDYQNPWLIRSLVSIGLRTENRILRKRWAEEVVRSAPFESADFGAALCVLAYAWLDSVMTQDVPVDELLLQIENYLCQHPNNPNVLRWQVSLCYVMGLIALSQGHRIQAQKHFQRVVDLPVSEYSSTLLTKPAEAAYLIGVLHASDSQLPQAKVAWANGLDMLLGCIGQRLSAKYAELPPGFELREIAAALSIAGRLAVAIGQSHSATAYPTIFDDEVNSDFVAQVSWLNEQCESWRRAAVQHQAANRELHIQVQDLLEGKAWLSSQTEAWRRAAAELQTANGELHVQVRDLLEGKAWLSSQCESWQNVAVDREEQIRGLRAQVQDFLEGHSWLNEQVDSWRRAADEQAEQNRLLRIQSQDLLEGNTWLTEQCGSWQKAAGELEVLNKALQARVDELLDFEARTCLEMTSLRQTSNEREQANRELETQLQGLRGERVSLTAECQSLRRFVDAREQEVVALTTEINKMAGQLNTQAEVLRRIREHWGLRFFGKLFRWKILN